MSTTDSVPSFSNQAAELLRQKLASAEAEANKLSMLLADDDSLMSHTDVQLTNGSAVLSDEDAELASIGWKLDTVSPVLADVTKADTSEGSIISRVCRLEGAVSSFRSTITRVSRERDHWRREKLASDERCTRSADALKSEITRLRRDAESECSKTIEAKEKAEQMAEQLRNDLVYVNYVFLSEA